MLPKFHFTIERWKYNPTFELYVSNMGHIRNKSKADIAPRVTKNGYMTVKVNGSINKHMLLHRVVMLTWKPTPEAEKLTVDHLDHNKRNNALDNLEWVTREENWTRASKDLYNDAATAKVTPVQTKDPTPKPAKYYQAGKKLIFHTLKEAGAWCMSQSGPDLTLEKAMETIEVKCKSGKSYCGRKWKKVGY